MLTIRRPDDWHLHLRDGAMMEGVIGWSADHIGRAIIMPNLVPPVVTMQDATDYRARIEAALEKSGAGGHPRPGVARRGFKPLMTLYLTETTDPDDVAAAAESGLITGVKLYPAGATTNSRSGVRDLSRAMGVLERMAEIGLPLLVHGEVADDDVDIFDREAVFIDRVLDPLRQRLPELRVVLEHMTTAEGVAYVRSADKGLAATITTLHLIINRNAILAGGIRPHYYCLPVAKREHHRLALREAATSGDPRFFSGTDSAPHTDAAKLSECGCAGCFSAPVSLPCLAHVFEEEGALDRLEGFVSLAGAAFHGMEPSAETITLIREEEPVSYPAQVSTGDGPVTVFDPGFPIHWRIADKAEAEA